MNFGECGICDPDKVCACPEPASSSNGELSDLKAFAGKACIDFYLSLHVSQMKEQTDQAKKVWSAGQELYLATKQGSQPYKHIGT